MNLEVPMKYNKITISIALIISALLFLVGYSYISSSEPTGETSSEFMGITTSNARYHTTFPASDELYPNCDLYKDDLYSYYVNHEDSYITAIVKNDLSIDPSNQDSITWDMAENIATEIFYFCNKQIDSQNVKIITRDGVEYIYEFEFIEILNGIESGTKALIQITNRGEILCAAFLKQEKILNRSAIAISENQAQLIMQDTILKSTPEEEIIKAEIDFSEYQASVKTFHDRTYWYIQTNVQIENNQSEHISRFYEIKIDYYSGEVLEIASQV